MEKLRVWWMPQIEADIFYVPVQSVEAGKKLIDIFAAYDAFQLQNKIKPDYCNIGGLERFNEEEKTWEEWRFDTEEVYFDDVDSYCESEYCEQSDELTQFGKEVMKQIDWDKINAMTQK